MKIMYKKGMRIRIVRMEGEPQYDGKVGIVEFVDGIGQLHGTWGGLAVQPERDTLQVLQDEPQNQTRN